MKLASIYYAAQRLAWRWIKPRTRGVKVMLFDVDGRLLLIRNSYGDQSAFVLPGGGVKPFEVPADAARREIREELCCDLEEVREVATYQSKREGKRDTIWLFAGLANGVVMADAREVTKQRSSNSTICLRKFRLQRRAGSPSTRANASARPRGKNARVGALTLLSGLISSRLAYFEEAHGALCGLDRHGIIHPPELFGA